MRSPIRWQMYWSSWGLQYKKIPDDFGPTIVYLIIGPLQMTWYET